MVYITKWDDFCDRSLKLYQSNPTKTRYCVRYRHTKSLLVLKVTDDTTCLKFKTYSAVFLNRFDHLTKRFTAAMQSRPVDDPTPTLPSVTAIAGKIETSSGGATGSGGGGAGGKKKKKKK